MSTVPNSSLGFLEIVGKPPSPVCPDPQSASTDRANAIDCSANQQMAIPEQQLPAVPSTANGEIRRINRSKSPRKLHRIGEVRTSQGVSERTMCKRLRVDAKQLRQLEDPTTDLSLSTLAEIREALDVPFADLLVESNSLSRPVQERAQLVKIMKTAVSLKECKLAPRAARLAQMLSEQLIELMPELADIGGWPEFGSRRSTDSIARILESEVNTSHLRYE